MTCCSTSSGCNCSSIQQKQELREGMSTGTKVVLGLLVFLVGIPTLIGLFVFLRHKGRKGKLTGK
jgi:hypothetical protein